MRSFNTSGPCVPGLHYMVPPEPRLPGALDLIGEGLFFVVHAPRQTGKTTTLAALARDVNAAGRQVALLISCERAEAAGDDYGAAAGEILGAIAEEALTQGLPADLMPPSSWPDAPPGSRLHSGLSAWARACPLPVVLLFDEIDALRGQSLLSVLRQLRDGFRSRPRSFPASVVLCGLRDVRDYRIASGADPSRLGTASPFNISVESFLISDFTQAQVADLYGQRTAETGQEFTAEAVQRSFDYTQGQPWLVNAIAREVVVKMGIKPSEPVTASHVDEAKERLILARATHLDSLASKLTEPRVRRVIEPLIAGTLPEVDATFNDDAAYVRDLGLIGPGQPIAVANPIYREVIARVLGARTEAVITVQPDRYLLPDGRLNFPKTLAAFKDFWVENSDVLTSGTVYPEAAPQLIMMAFLARIVNGGGYIDREYGVGRGRVDLLIRKPFTGPDGQAALQREAIELKVWRSRQKDPLAEGLVQLDRYLGLLGLDTGTLIIFDGRPQAPPVAERTKFSTRQTPAGRAITLLRA